MNIIQFIVVFIGGIIIGMDVGFYVERWFMNQKQLCGDCKHLEHDGMAGIWCGVRGNNKNHDCPKFERKYKKATEPTYYNKNGLSPLKAYQQGLLSYEEYIGFIKGNIIKYVVRCDKKGQGLSDVDKAMDYLELLKKEMSD